jgi:pimeloyl-ACP methyl ester carboxylesterase
MVMAMAIDRLESVELGGTTQWIRVRGADLSNPVMLLMQLGPGLPIINETRRFERLLGLEDTFTVVYWDQRGTGLSLRDPRLDGLSPHLMVADTVSLLELLRERFEAKTLVTGFSFGATFAAYAAARRPDLVATLVAVGMDIDVPAAEANAYEFALSTARRRGNRRAVRQLETIGPPPHLATKEFMTRVRWVSNLGGVSTNTDLNGTFRALLASLARSPDYSVADIVRTVRGITSTQAALLPELASTDLVRTVTQLEVPIVMVQGRLDQVAPPEAAQAFHDSLTAPGKQLVWLDESAHTPHLEQPDKFRDVLMAVNSDLRAY